MFFKADWDALAVLLGFPTWASKFYPCCICLSPKETLFEEEGWDIDNCPFVLTTAVELERACAACEIWVAIPDRETHRRVAILLGSYTHVTLPTILRCEFSVDGTTLQ